MSRLSIGILRALSGLQDCTKTLHCVGVDRWSAVQPSRHRIDRLGPECSIYLQVHPCYLQPFFEDFSGMYQGGGRLARPSIGGAIV